MIQGLAKFIIRIAGWQTTGELPDLKKAVFIAAYHTSNWDGFWLIVYKFALKVNVRFLAKHTLFWWPLGSLLRSIGAMPVDRSKSSSVVQQLVTALEEEDHMFLALSPEGTRDFRPYWKSGFYQIAKAAGVPVVLAFIDYRKKTMGIGIRFETSDIDTDLRIIRDFYADVTPRHEHLKGPIEFRANQASANPSPR